MVAEAYRGSAHGFLNRVIRLADSVPGPTLRDGIADGRCPARSMTWTGRMRFSAASSGRRWP